MLSPKQPKPEPQIMPIFGRYFVLSNKYFAAMLIWSYELKLGNNNSEI